MPEAGNIYSADAEYSIYSEVEFAFLSYSEHLLRAVFESAGSGNRLDSSMSLYLNFRVLFPSTNICWHVVKHDFLFQEFVHLALDWILITCLNERCCIINAGHCVEVFVLTREDAADSEIVIE